VSTIVLIVIVVAILLVIGCAFVLAYILNLVISIDKEIKEIKIRLLKDK
jgi:hypothetical protein